MDAPNWEVEVTNTSTPKKKPPPEVWCVVCVWCVWCVWCVVCGVWCVVCGVVCGVCGVVVGVGGSDAFFLCVGVCPATSTSTESRGPRPKRHGSHGPAPVCRAPKDRLCSPVSRHARS